MRDKSLQDLEFHKVLQKLSKEASSALGRQACLDLRPATSYEEVIKKQQETDDLLQEIIKKGDFPLSGFDDIGELLKMLDIGTTASPGDLLRVARQLRLVQRVRERVEELDSDEQEELEVSSCLTLVSELDPLDYLEERIDECILNDEELKDRASPELYAIRRQIQSYQDDIHTQLNKILRSQEGLLQEQLITLRSDRYVIPVKAEHKGQIQGIVHDSSASGATVFIEPIAVVNLNNKIREAKIEEKHEILRILKALSELTLGYKDILLRNQKNLVYLDFTQAKAKLALHQDARKPELNNEGKILLKQARHPLIPKETVVPIDFELGYDFTSLVITGPNTGGKTVSLKTCGLLTLMAMSGLQIPTKSGSHISYFEHVLADIGDEQSIEQSLSTFSSHMKQIIEICDIAGPSTLVIADELGAGTDPSEGAALAIAILDFLKNKGAHIVASTHYQELKGYAMNTKGVSNASSEFDNISMKPTYRLLIGVPGVSNAINISTRLGLQSEIIEAAKSLISDEGAQFQSLIEAIERSHKKSKTMEEEIELLHREAEKNREENEKEKRRIREEREKLLSEARSEAYKILAKAEYQAEQELKGIRSIGIAVQESEEAKQRLSEQRRALEEEMGEERLRAGIDRALEAEDLIMGESYEDVLSGFSGQLLEMPDNKDRVLIGKGNVNLRVALTNLKPITKKEEPIHKDFNFRVPKTKVSRQMHSANLYTKSELYLLGFRVNDALLEVDRYLDDAALAGLESVRIVHGKGTGALRNAVREKLRNDKRVKHYEDAAFGAGDAGVTVVELC